MQRPSPHSAGGIHAPNLHTSGSSHGSSSPHTRRPGEQDSRTQRLSSPQSASLSQSRRPGRQTRSTHRLTRIFHQPFYPTAPRRSARAFAGFRYAPAGGPEVLAAGAHVAAPGPVRSPACGGGFRPPAGRRVSARRRPRSQAKTRLAGALRALAAKPGEISGLSTQHDLDSIKDGT